MPGACLSGQVVVIGSANLDLIVTACQLPREGETVLGGELRLSNGGKGANQAVAALKAGAEVRLLAKVGCDPFGDRIYRDLVAAGLSADGLLRDESAPTGIALIVADRQGCARPSMTRRLMGRETGSRKIKRAVPGAKTAMVAGRR